MMKFFYQKSAFKIFYFFSLMFFFCTLRVTNAQNILQITKQQWIEDLNYVTKTLINKHPNIFYRISKEDFELTVANAVHKIRNSQSEEESFVALQQVVASIQDGHTMLGTNNLPGYREIFPVRMYEFSDGIYITGIAKAFGEYVGAKVIKIGQYTAEEALERSGALAFADNEFYRKEQAPQIVITCKLAKGLGITETIDRLPLLVESENGGRKEIFLSPVTPQGVNNMLRGIDIGPTGVPFESAFTNTKKELPTFIKHLDEKHNYWYEHNEEQKMIYMQFNLIVDQQDESFTEFCSRMFKYIDDHNDSVDKFILDLRFNNGGNGPIVLPFINEIIKRDNINRLGHFYTLIGRRSFSAAVLLVAEIMIHTHTLLVGEPTGAAQNMFSDYVYYGNLPNSDAALLISSEYFNIAWPSNKNYMITPHYPVKFSSSDFFSGEDPALEAILANKVTALETVLYKEGPKAALNYFHEIKCDWGEHTEELCITPSTFPISTKYKGESEVNDMGYIYLNQNRLEDARAAFELNVTLYPHSYNAWDSYAEFFVKNGDYPTAIRFYKKSLELNPNNQSALEMIEQLEKK